MKRSAKKYGVPWYSPDSWPRLKATAVDPEVMKDTYEEWRVSAESTLKALCRRGVWLEKVEIDIDALLAWCAAQDRAIDAAARYAYVEHLLQQHDLDPDQRQAGPKIKGIRSHKGARPKGLSAKAQQLAMAAEQLYREERLPVDVITQQLNISKSTLYRYLRHQGVQIGGKER